MRADEEADWKCELCLNYLRGS